MIVKIEPTIKRYLTNFLKYRDEKHLIQCDIKRLEMSETIITKNVYMKYYNKLNYYNMHLKFNDYIVCKTVNDRMKLLKDKSLSCTNIYKQLDKNLEIINVKNGTFNIVDDMNNENNKNINNYITNKYITDKYIIYLLTNDISYIQ